MSNLRKSNRLQYEVTEPRTSAHRYEDTPIAHVTFHRPGLVAYDLAWTRVELQAVQALFTAMLADWPSD